MNQKRRLVIPKLIIALCALSWLLFPSAALAHVVNRRFGDFYAGMLHPFAGFEHILPIVAIALLAGQRGAAVGRAVLLAFPLALSVFFGLTQGYANGVDTTNEVSASLFLFGVVATSVILIAFSAATVVSLKSDWQHVAVRVAGSWILAIGIMMFGLV